MIELEFVYNLRTYKYNLLRSNLKTPGGPEDSAPVFMTYCLYRTASNEAK
jgi:hypothetical protein